MRIGHFISFGCLLLFFTIAQYAAGRAPLKDREADGIDPAIVPILRDASQLALKQGEHESFWTQAVLLQIAKLQIRANDLDGALRSLRGPNGAYIDDSCLSDVVRALARAGKKDRAIEVSRLLNPGWGWTGQRARDVVQFHWAELLIARGDLRQARKAIDEIKSPQERHEALRKLASAHASFGDLAQARKYFIMAIDTAASIDDDFDRARTLQETADAQRLAGLCDDARTTLLRLVENAERHKDRWTRTCALRECAVLAARLNESDSAQNLFDRAIRLHSSVEGSNPFGPLAYIAVAQASAGFIDGARKTALMIKHSDHDFTVDSHRGSALCEIARAQLKAGDSDGAIRTATSIEYFVQYRDDALRSVVAYYIDKREFKAALAATEKFDNTSRKTSAILQVAAGQTRVGDSKGAADAVACVQLTSNSKLRKLLHPDDKGFEFGQPQSWGENYDADDSFTMASHAMTVRHTAEVAAAAMELAQALQIKPSDSFADFFKDVNEEVVQSLARSHVKYGRPEEASAWAKQIGSDETIPKKDADRVRWAVERRIHALLGVAEGMLERGKK
jgi:tetratricopeptide (TPR) repeat protein